MGTKQSSYQSSHPRLAMKLAISKLCPPALACNAAGAGALARPSWSLIAPAAFCSLTNASASRKRSCLLSPGAKASMAAACFGACAWNCAPACFAAALGAWACAGAGAWAASSGAAAGALIGAGAGACMQVHNTSSRLMPGLPTTLRICHNTTSRDPVVWPCYVPRFSWDSAEPDWAWSVYTADGAL